MVDLMDEEDKKIFSDTSFKKDLVLASVRAIIGALVLGLLIYLALTNQAVAQYDVCVEMYNKLALKCNKVISDLEMCQNGGIVLNTSSPFKCR